MLKGVFQLAYLPPVYMAGVVPEGVTLNLEMNSPWDARTKGTFDQMDKFMQKKNIKYLGWTGYPIHFQTYLKDARDKMDLTGLILRGAPQYIGLIEALGGKMVVIPAGEVYTALERGMVQGFCWPEVGISDYGWHELVKYYWGPPFYSMETIFIMKLDTWNELHKDQKAAIDTVIKDLEREQAAYNTGRIDTDRNAMLKFGLKQIKFSPEDEAKFIKLANEEGWKYFLKSAPEAAVLKPLMSK
jgi:TRAP-type C4-dicarboxylate transport system substrate-binding protein